MAATWAMAQCKLPNPYVTKPLRLHHMTTSVKGENRNKREKEKENAKKKNLYCFGVRKAQAPHAAELLCE